MGLAHAASDGFGNDPAARPAAGRGGLVSLLAHDLRVPLGPLALATSSLASDPAIDGSAKEFARIAHAQSAKVGRLMGAALAASGRLPGMRRMTLSVPSLLQDAAAAFASLGGRLDVMVAGAVVEVGTEAGSAVVADPTLLAECLLNVAELAAGPACATRVVVEPGERIVISFACDDSGRCAAAFSKDAPDDSDSAFALATLAVIGALGGAVELTDSDIVLSLPSAEGE